MRTIIMILMAMALAAGPCLAQSKAADQAVQAATEQQGAEQKPEVAPVSPAQAPAAPPAIAGQPQEEKAAPSGQPATAAGKFTSTMPVTGTYVIGPGDIIEASVWRDDVLRGQFVVLPDGHFSFPLIGELKAEGRTLSELKQEMTERLSTYVTDLVLSVEVKQVNSMLIYIIGRVNQPNRFVLNTNVNVLQALAMAGGLNPFAKRQSIKVFRTEDGRTKLYPFHYDDVVEGRRLEENIILKRGDVVVVP